MASNPNFPSVTYAGEHYAEVFGPAVIDPAGLVDQNLATPIDNTKFKGVVNEMDDTVEFQNPNPIFNGQSSQATVPETVVEAIPYEFHKEVRMDDLRKSWFQSQIAAGSLNDYQGEELLNNFLTKVYVPKLKAANANLMLQGKQNLAASIGSYSFSADYPGLYAAIEAKDTNKIAAGIGAFAVTGVTKGTTTTLTVASGAAEKVEIGNIISLRGAAGGDFTGLNGDHVVIAKPTATTVVIDLDSDAFGGTYTASSAVLQYINRHNIIQVIAQTLSRVPVAVRRDPSFRIVIPSELELEWQFANAQVQQNGGSYYLQGYQLQFINAQIVVLDMAPANTVGMWTPKRVFNVFDLSSDVNTVNAIWLGETTGDQIYRLRGAMKTGIEITSAFPKEITLYRPFKA